MLNTAWRERESPSLSLGFHNANAFHEIWELSSCLVFIPENLDKKCFTIPKRLMVKIYSAIFNFHNQEKKAILFYSCQCHQHTWIVHSTRWTLENVETKLIYQTNPLQFQIFQEFQKWGISLAVIIMKWNKLLYCVCIIFKIFKSSKNWKEIIFMEWSRNRIDARYIIAEVVRKSPFITVKLLIKLQVWMFIKENFFLLSVILLFSNYETR
jgi:hypothetical protein